MNTQQKEILNEIQNFYQNLYASKNIPDTSIHKYIEDFTPPIFNNIKTSSQMGNDRSPDSQHNVGDTIIYDAQRQTNSI